MEDFSNYEKLKENTSSFYLEIRKIFSPALNEEITFSAEGFNHLVFKGSRSEREKSSQILEVIFERQHLLPIHLMLLLLRLRVAW